jgi:two-component system, cell cycle response regulator DivK
VVEAADGAQAVAAARWSHPQIVVMDLEMPVLDGYEAARQIKSDPANGNPTLIALTGAQTDNAVPRARAAGFSYFVRKEVDARGFVEKIARLVKDSVQELAAQPPAPALVVARPEPAPPKKSRRKAAARRPRRKASR